MTITNQILKKTIETSSYFTVAESLLLIKLLDIEENSLAEINPRSLQEEFSLSHTSIYNAIKKLVAKGFLLKLSTKRNSYKIQKDKLEHFYQFVRD